jgi:hypothetical protein
VISEAARKCSQCLREQPPGAFRAATGFKNGRSAKCRDCEAVSLPRSLCDRKSVRGSLLRDPQSGSVGEFTAETLAARRDEYILYLHAASCRWRDAEDQEDRDGAREALLFRCRQLIEAEGLVST